MENEELIVGRKYAIHGYKHDGKIHRSWDEAVLIEIHDDYLIFGNHGIYFKNRSRSSGVPPSKGSGIMLCGNLLSNFIKKSLSFFIFYYLIYSLFIAQNLIFSFK